MTYLRIRVLGSPQIEIAGAGDEFERRKAVALLVYLVVSAAQHGRDSLAALLWPEFDHECARNGLRRTLSVINKASDVSVLATDRETVRIAPEVDSWLDAQEFQQNLAAFRQHDHSNDKLCDDCVIELTQAVALYLGDFLAGFSLRDSPAYDEWQFFQAESLRREQAITLEKLTRHFSAMETYEQAIQYARSWLALDGLNEAAHRQLIRLYAWSNQRTAALRQYEECSRLLEQELGTTPQTETEQLYESINRKAALRQTFVRVLSGPGATPGRRFSLSASTTIGFSHGSDIFPNDDFVSNTHARIVRTSGQYALHDLESTNGTQVNKQKLSSNIAHRLTRGDVIQIGDTKLVFEYLEQQTELEPVSRSTIRKIEN